MVATCHISPPMIESDHNSQLGMAKIGFGWVQPFRFQTHMSICLPGYGLKPEFFNYRSRAGSTQKKSGCLPNFLTRLLGEGMKMNSPSMLHAAFGSLEFAKTIKGRTNL